MYALQRSAFMVQVVPASAVQAGPECKLGLERFQYLTTQPVKLIHSNAHAGRMSTQTMDLQPSWASHSSSRALCILRCRAPP